MAAKDESQMQLVEEEEELEESSGAELEEEEEDLEDEEEEEDDLDEGDREILNSCYMPSRVLSRRQRFRLHEFAAAGQTEQLRLHLPDIDESNLVVNTALNRRDIDGCTALHHSIINAQLDCFRLLLRAGADPSVRCEGSHPVHMLVAVGSLQPFPHADSLKFAEAALELLLAHPAHPPVDLGARDDHGRTPSLLAAQLGLPSLLRMLVDAAGEHSLLGVDTHGNTLLHYAAKHSDLATLELVLSSPVIANLPLTNNEGETPLHIAAHYNNVGAARRLLASSLGEHPLRTTRTALGYTPQQVAARRGFPDLAAVLGSGQQPGQAEELWAQAEASAGMAPGQTLVLCDERCEEHYTCADPIRPYSEPPSENVRRLLVLTHPSYGVLRAKPFAGRLQWVEQAERAAITDILRVHEYSYVRRLDDFCRNIPDDPATVKNLDPDTSISRRSFEAALRAAGASCQAVDRVMLPPAPGQAPVRNAFCAVRPPGHHAGPFGVVTSPHDPNGSHGFCLLNNVAIAAAYARATYRHLGVRRVAILDFDVHHGNGTEAIVRNVQPSEVTHFLKAPFLHGKLSSFTYKPWLDASDKDEIFFASVHGYGRKDEHYGAYFYPGSGCSNCGGPAPPTVASALAAEADPEAEAKEPEPVNSRDLGDILPPWGCDQQKRLPGPSEQDFPPHPHHTHHRQRAPNHGDAAGAGAGEAAAEAPPSWIYNVGLPLIDPERHLTRGRREWRKAWRDVVLAQLYRFRPDMIFISAGFDAHCKDLINFGYLSVREDDYYWLTREICIAANTLCQGRVVSVLEGGYKVEGRVVSAFGRSVAEHVRALAEASAGETFRAEDWSAERARERAEELRLAREAQEALEAARQEDDAEQQAFLARLRALQEQDAARPPQAEAEDQAAEPEAEPEEGGRRASRRRRGAPVDYAKLNAEMDDELARKRQKQNHPPSDP